MSRKPRPEAVLKKLPDERQAEIIEHLKANSYAATRKWLRADGLQTSPTALSLFWSWWHLRQQFRQDEETTNSLIEQLKSDLPNLTDVQLDELGQRTFSLLAIRNQNLKGFVQLRSAMTKAQFEREKIDLRKQAEARMAEALKLQRDQFQFDAAKAALKFASELQAVNRNSKLSEPEKVNLARQKLFGVLPT